MDDTSAPTAAAAASEDPETLDSNTADAAAVDIGTESLVDDLKEDVEAAKEFVEELIEKGEDFLGIKHGTHAAAVTGLQTDASRSYTPPVVGQ